MDTCQNANLKKYIIEVVKAPLKKTKGKTYDCRYIGMWSTWKNKRDLPLNHKSLHSKMPNGDLRLWIWRLSFPSLSRLKSISLSHVSTLNPFILLSQSSYPTFPFPNSLSLNLNPSPIYISNCFQNQRLLWYVNYDIIITPTIVSNINIFLSNIDPL